MRDNTRVAHLTTDHAPFHTEPRTPTTTPHREGDRMPARGAGAAVRTVRGSRKRRTATRATGSEGHTHWHARVAERGEG
jgi:hypothetical protein